MIYIIRHQHGSSFSNCLTKHGLEESIKIAKQCGASMNHLEIYTFLPLMNGHHIRVIQTAATIGTILKLNVSFIDMNTCPNYSNDVDILIIAHHSQIPDILSKYATNSFQWPFMNYCGCIIISKNSWTFNDSFFKPKKNKWLKLCFIFLPCILRKYSTKKKNKKMYLSRDSLF